MPHWDILGVSFSKLSEHEINFDIRKYYNSEARVPRKCTDMTPPQLQVARDLVPHHGALQTWVFAGSVDLAIAPYGERLGEKQVDWFYS